MGKFSSWFKGLFTSKSKADYTTYIASLENLLIDADFSPSLAKSAVKAVQQQFDKQKDPSIESVLIWFKSYLKNLYEQSVKVTASTADDLPRIILMVGVNGAGKTTSCAKLAYHYLQLAQQPLLVAADTFRAGAVKQLQLWGERIHVPVIANELTKDPASLVYEGVEQGVKTHAHVVICDTAGRLQTKDNLMSELAKLRRVVQKKSAHGPHETLLVIDASQGQNALIQAQVFHQATPLTGIVLTKLDGISKGGIIWSIATQLKVGVTWIGTGEKISDWEPFSIITHIERLFSEGDEMV